ncbi:protein PTST homolog 2, chloroplastic-like [Bidens hawaiensis]|uniref:protein PTST homolog 2, chloroplastic-like n=1 Tax=Bidens hawaiensis TaxID=980011 RepID=UPI004049F079
MPLTTFSSNVNNLIPHFASYIHPIPNLNPSIKTVTGFVKKDWFLEVKCFKKIRTTSWILCKDLFQESEFELGLEGEIMEFMEGSRNPNCFPSKKELLEAGRGDLVDAIIEKGGWMTLGWDDFDDDNMEFDDVNSRFELSLDSCRSSDQCASSSGRSVDVSSRLDPSLTSCCSSDQCASSSGRLVYDVRDVNSRFDVSLNSCRSSHQCASSSGRSIETVFHEDAWIEGALYRLENIRSMSCGTSMQEDGPCIYDFSKVNDGQSVYGSLDVDSTAIVEKSNKHEDTDSDDIKSRLQQMELELSSSFRLLRLTKVDKTNDHKSSSSQLQRLPDTRELHENENINVKDRLKSVCAKLAVLEGKMSSSIIDAQKLVKKKQTKTDGGCKSLQLHNICIMWHDSASKVLLVGSVDGWTSQRKMKKSEAGVFYLSLKLYPGKYEYKFLVDGVWKLDSLRPTVKNNGYENNLLIIPE